MSECDCGIITPIRIATLSTRETFNGVDVKVSVWDDGKTTIIMLDGEGTPVDMITLPKEDIKFINHYAQGGE